MTVALVLAALQARRRWKMVDQCAGPSIRLDATSASHVTTQSALSSWRSMELGTLPQAW